MAGRRCWQRDSCTIRHCYCVNVFSFADIIGKGKVSAGIVDLQFLRGIAGDGYIFITAFIFRIGIAVDLRRNFGILDTDLVYSLDQCILVSRKVLQIVSDSIRSIGRNKLIFNR